MAALNTETDTMTIAANHVADIAQQINQEMNSLQLRLASLDSAWRGSAKMAFNQLMLRWQDAGKQLNNSLNTISDTIRANSVAYQTTQEEHQAQLNTINI